MENPPETNNYETIKSALIKRLTDSDATRTRKLLETEEIGDRTPSQYWRHLKQLASDSVTEQFLVDLWKSRLPTKTQEILSVTEDKEWEKLTAIADRIHDVSLENPRIAVVTEPQENHFKTLLEKVESLQLQISAIATNSRSRNRSRSRAHSDRRDAWKTKKVRVRTFRSQQNSHLHLRHGSLKSGLFDAAGFCLAFCYRGRRYANYRNGFLIIL